MTRLFIAVSLGPCSISHSHCPIFPMQCSRSVYLCTIPVLLTLRLSNAFCGTSKARHHTDYLFCLLQTYLSRLILTPVGVVVMTLDALLLATASFLVPLLSLGRENSRTLFRDPVPKLNIVLLSMPSLKPLGFANYCAISAALPRAPPWSTVTISRPFIYLPTRWHHQLTKHIEIDIHFVWDQVVLGLMRVLHAPSRFQFADVFNKGLPSALFQDFISSLNVRSATVSTAGMLT